MPRDLADVIHHLLPAPAAEASPAAARSASQPVRAQEQRRAPVLGVPVGESDVVRAAFLWNLAIELARRGSPSTLLAPAIDRETPLWPERDRGVLGCQTLRAAASDLEALSVRAERSARDDAQGSRRAIVLVRVPPTWIDRAPEDPTADALRWSLFLSSPDGRDLGETFQLIERVARTRPDARLGVTIHGAQRVDDARRAFDRLAEASETRLGRALTSYGMLVDDLHVYRAIVGQRPIGLAHPQSPASLALADVARLIAEDTQGSHA